MTDVLAIHGLALSTADGQELARCDRMIARSGSVIGVVGPSGSGKTTLLRSIAGAVPNAATVVRGSIRVLDRTMLRLSNSELRRFRNRHIGFVGQDPAARLNPHLRVRGLLAEASRADRSEADRILGDLDLPATDDLLRRRPRELSGGQQRRVALARALARRPDLLLLDEPTAGLDGPVRERLRRLLRRQAEEHGATILLACHDMSMIEHLADDVFDLGARTVPNLDARMSPRVSAPVPGTSAVLRVDGLSAWTDARRRRPILTGVDLQVPGHGALAVVGASGAGKTTLARAIAGLHPTVEGRVHVGDDEVALQARRRDREQLRRVQLVPQDPLGTLNPSRTVAHTLSRPLLSPRRSAGRDRRPTITDLLAAVGLAAEVADRHPHELSGGQRQRVAIARAIAAGPDILVCDEITSCLDAATSASIMRLLSDLRTQRDLTLIVITHDLTLAAKCTDATVVLDHGRIVRRGATSDVLRGPSLAHGVSEDFPA